MRPLSRPVWCYVTLGDCGHRSVRCYVAAIAGMHSSVAEHENAIGSGPTRTPDVNEDTPLLPFASIYHEKPGGINLAS